MFPTNAAQWHAALNDFPSILLLLSVVLDLAGGMTRRDSLKAAAFWTLVVGAGGAVLALVSGLAAEEAVEHGQAVHELLERHELMGKALTALVVGLGAWRIWRRGSLGGAERQAYLVVAGAGAVFVLWTAHLGGRIVFEHAGGIPTNVIEDAVADRETERERELGEEHETPAAPADSPEEGADQTNSASTPERKHE
ncbi:MAG: DUF2231 domain-containing protein [Gemmatimonadales bacterium]